MKGRTKSPGRRCEIRRPGKAVMRDGVSPDACLVSGPSGSHDSAESLSSHRAVVGGQRGFHKIIIYFFGLSLFDFSSL